MNITWATAFLLSVLTFVQAKHARPARTHNSTSLRGLRKGKGKNATSSPKRPILFEGDIVPDYEAILEGYGPEVVKELEEQGMLFPGEDVSNMTTRQADVNRRWSTRVNDVVEIPYAFAFQFTSSSKAVIENALKTLGDNSKVVKFVPRTSQVDYISITGGNGCWSRIGRQGGKQDLNLHSVGCVTNGIVQHEFLHALGFYHEQSRSDRDSFVRINTQNIDPSKLQNFEKRTDMNSLSSPYDYGSVMHYAKDEFSVNEQDTITAPQAIGQRIAASAEDIRQLRLLYQCKAGARSLMYFIAFPCTSDCKCWEGATGCNGNNLACQAGLVCNSANQCARSGTRTFRSSHNTYLSGWTDQTVRLMAHAQAWEGFTVSSVGNGKVSIRSIHGTYLSAWPDSPDVRLMPLAQSWEHWTFVPNSDGSVSLLSIHGTYLSAWTDGTVHLMPHNLSWEHWF